MKRVLVPIIALLLSPVASAKWLNNDSKDEIPGLRTISSFSYNSKQAEKIGVRCDIERRSTTFKMTFKVDSSLGMNGSEVDFLVRVDDNQPIQLRGRLDANSYKSGYINATGQSETLINELLTQMIPGRKAYVKIQNDRRSEIIDFDVSLSGFTAKSKDVLSACNVAPQTVAMNLN